MVCIYKTKNFEYLTILEKLTLNQIFKKNPVSEFPQLLRTLKTYIYCVYKTK